MKVATLVFVVAAAALAFEPSATAQEIKPALPDQGAAGAPAGEITLIGNVYCDAHTGEKGDKVYFMALDGTPEIKKEFDSIIDKFYPEKGLDGDAARALENEFNSRLKYNVDGPQKAALRKEVAYTGRELFSMTGVISQRDGAKWLTVSEHKAGAEFTWPAKMLTPDNPLAALDNESLALKINDTVSIKCLHVPPGKFLRGEPYYMVRSWMEDPPHMVTLTKGYYLAETPITWEQYQAATGTDPRKNNEQPQSAANLSSANVHDFCRLLSKTSGRKVRPPTSSELLFAYRCGTSNPPFVQKYAGKGIVADGTAPVKATQPNPWGFYEWMCDFSFERTGDATASEHKDVTDPVYTPKEELADPRHVYTGTYGGFGMSGWEICEFEYIPGAAAHGGKKGYGPNVRERIVVEEAAAEDKK